MEHTWQQFVSEYDEWVWENWPTAATLQEVNRELRELANEST